jgi:signal recognition particle receptor subunit beta
MVYFSPATREITAKIVYYGPGMCGKTTNLQKVHELMRPQMKSDLVSVATETDRTIYFDFLPLKLGKIAGFDFVVRTFTVPGQPYYAETRKMVLQGADGIVFCADSQRYMLDQNKDSLMDLKRNLKLNGLDYRTIPMVLQWNKRDLPDTMDPADLDAALNDRRVATFEASAVRGLGVVETLKGITLQVFKHVRDGGLSKAGAAPGKPQVQANAAPAATTMRAPSQAPAPAAAPAPVATGHHASTDMSQFARQPQTGAGGGGGGLGGLVNQVVANAQEGTAPMPSKDDIGLQEFRNLAVLVHKLTERVAQLEQELNRLGGDHTDLKRIVGRKLG